MTDALVTAVCALTGWADNPSLRERVARHAADVATARGLALATAVNDRDFLQALIERCSVSETYFFRHREQLTAVCAEVQRTFPTERLVAWSAGCATGEEAWSLAMTLYDGGVSAERLHVVGTDVSEAALAHARAGRYGDWSFRGVPAALRERHFERRDGASVVAEPIAHTVHFTRHNLLAPPPVPRAHLVLCRNALIYFRKETARAVLDQLVSVLAPGGVLALGAAEQHLATDLPLHLVEVDGTVYFQAPRAATVTPLPTLPPEEATPPRVVTQPAPTTCEVEAAWTALRAGRVDEARALAATAASRQVAEAHLVLATLEVKSEDPGAALEHLRRALYLDPSLIVAHATQATLFERLGRAKEARRARANALRHLRALTPETVLRAATPVTARELQASLEVS